MEECMASWVAEQLSISVDEWIRGRMNERISWREADGMVGWMSRWVIERLTGWMPAP